MARLEDLTRGAQVRGLRPDGPVTILDVQWHGSTCVELTYKDAAGRPYTELFFRDREPMLANNLPCHASVVLEYNLQACPELVEWANSAYFLTTLA